MSIQGRYIKFHDTAISRGGPPGSPRIDELPAGDLGGLEKFIRIKKTVPKYSNWQFIFPPANSRPFS